MIATTILSYLLYWLIASVGAALIYLTFRRLGWKGPR